MKEFLVHLKSNHFLTVAAFKFEAEHLTGNQGSITFFKSDTEPDETIVVKFYDVLYIIPSGAADIEKEFRVFLKNEKTFNVYADHFKVWDSDMISFRDAQDKHLNDLYVDYKEVVAILPL